jgi:hypothetical protein
MPGVGLQGSRRRHPAVSECLRLCLGPPSHEEKDEESSNHETAHCGAYSNASDGTCPKSVSASCVGWWCVGARGR